MSEHPIRIPVLIPDLPQAEALLPWLERLDESRQYTNFGPLVQEFEQALAQMLATDAGLPEVVTMNTGTAVLELAVAALALPLGAKVLLPSFTFAAAAGVLLRHRLTPVFADVSATDWLLTPALAQAALQHHEIALVMPVACFGCAVDVAGWDAFVAATGIPVLIDAAAAFGNQAVGELATVAFSFHATKPFGIGEGGALVTRNAELAAKVRQMSNFGYDGDRVSELGFNAKMSEYAAAVGLAQCARWPARQAQRQALWANYRQILGTLPGLRLQTMAAEAVPATLVVRLPVPAEPVAAALAQQGVQSRRWYVPPLHEHPAFAACLRCGPAGAAELPVTAALSLDSLGLPWYSDMSVAQCHEVVELLRPLCAP